MKIGFKNVENLRSTVSDARERVYPFVSEFVGRRCDVVFFAECLDGGCRELISDVFRECSDCCDKDYHVECFFAGSSAQGGRCEYMVIAIDISKYPCFDSCYYCPRRKEIVRGQPVHEYNFRIPVGVTIGDLHIMGYHCLAPRVEEGEVMNTNIRNNITSDRFNENVVIVGDWNISPPAAASRMESCYKGPLSWIKTTKGGNAYDYAMVSSSLREIQSTTETTLLSGSDHKGIIISSRDLDRFAPSQKSALSL